MPTGARISATATAADAGTVTLDESPQESGATESRLVSTHAMGGPRDHIGWHSCVCVREGSVVEARTTERMES